MINDKKVLAIIMANPTDGTYGNKHIMTNSAIYAACAFRSSFDLCVMAVRNSKFIDKIIIYAECKDILGTYLAKTSKIVFKNQCSNLQGIYYLERTALCAIESIDNNYDVFIFLQPDLTSLTSIDIDNAIEIYINSNALTCASVNIPNEYNDMKVRSSYRPYLVSLGDLKKFSDFSDNKEYVSNGIFYLVNMRYFLSKISFISHHSIMHNLMHTMDAFHFLRPIIHDMYFSYITNKLSKHCDTKSLCYICDCNTCDSYMIKKLGQRLKTLREQHELTLAEFALFTGKSIAMVSSVECGIIFPGLFTIEMFANRLNTTLEELFCSDPIDSQNSEHYTATKLLSPTVPITQCTGRSIKLYHE